MVGGLSITLGLLAGAAWADGLKPFERLLLDTGVVLAVIGAINDRHDLGVRARVLVQVVLVVAMMAATGIFVRHLGDLFGIVARLGAFGIPFTLLAMIGLLNAFNLIDGIDGLASLLALVAIGGILLTAGTLHAHSTGTLLLLLGVAMLPQLACNLGLLGPRCKCFLGDAGSTLLGYMVGWALIQYSQTPGSRLSPVGALWCVAIPVLDTLAVMVRRLRSGSSPFNGDRRHIHYLLMDAGFGARATLAIIIAAAAGCWGFGAIVRNLHLGAGTNLAAFCALLVAYFYATAKLEDGVARHAQVATPAMPTPASETAAALEDARMADAADPERD
jgi:UDP-GlcNAc:undecaprenyl-phosphate GlcNAc-1-phosphate transferase